MDEARQIVARQYSWRLPNGEPAPLSATEFDIGFIVMPQLPPPPPAPPGHPPTMSQPGTGAVIVDKRTGATTVLPYWGPEGTADRYRRMQGYRQH